MSASQYCTPLGLLWFGLGAQHCPDGFVEDVLESFLRQRGALQVLDGVDFLGHGQPLKQATCQQSALVGDFHGSP